MNIFVTANSGFDFDCYRSVFVFVTPFPASVSTALFAYWALGRDSGFRGIARRSSAWESRCSAPPRRDCAPWPPEAATVIAWLFQVFFEWLDHHFHCHYLCRHQISSSQGARSSSGADLFCVRANRLHYHLLSLPIWMRIARWWELEASNSMFDALCPVQASLFSLEALLWCWSIHFDFLLQSTSRFHDSFCSSWWHLRSFRLLRHFHCCYWSHRFSILNQRSFA